MNREETKRAAEVMLHYANGGEVQCMKLRTCMQWLDYGSGQLMGEPHWDWERLVYRIKPQPVEVVKWVWVQKGGSNPQGCFSKQEAEELAKVHGGYAVELKGTYTCES